MTPRTRTLILVGGVFFCVIFTLMTIAVTLDTGLNILTFTAFLVVLMVAIGLWGAIHNPPGE